MPKRQWTGLRPTLNAQSTSNDYWSQFPQVSASAGDVTAHTFDNRLKAPFFVDGRKKEEMEMLVTTTVTTCQTDIKPATDAAVT